MSVSGTTTAPMLGSGEVQDRFVRLEPYPKLPWYYDNTALMLAAAVAVAFIVCAGQAFG